METLPYELCVQVFSYLAMADWCEAVRTSHAWQSLVSRAVADKMQVVNINATNYAYLTPRIHCFSSVSSVILWTEHLKGNVLYQMLKQLSLHTTTLFKLELIRPSSIDEDRLIKALSTQTLKSLRLTKVAGPFLAGMTSILAACPNMAHFAYHVDQRAYHAMPRIALSTSTASSFYSLVSLCLSTRPVRHEVTALLRQCPCLEKLQLFVEARIDCQEVMAICPKLTHLHIGDPAILENMIQEDTIQTDCREDNDDGLLQRLRYFCLGDYKDAVMDKKDSATAAAVVAGSNSSWLCMHSSSLQVLHLPDLTTYPFYSDSVEIISCGGGGGWESYSLAVEQFPNARDIRLAGDSNRGSIAMKRTTTSCRSNNQADNGSSGMIAKDQTSWYSRDQYRPSDPPALCTMQFLEQLLPEDHENPAHHHHQLIELDMTATRLPSRILLTIASRAPLLVTLRLDTWHSTALDLTPLGAMPFLRDLTLVRIDSLRRSYLRALAGLSSLMLKQCSGLSASGLVELVGASRLKKLVMINCSCHSSSILSSVFDPANLIEQGRNRGVQVIVRDEDVRPWSYDIPLPNRASHRYYQ